MSAPNALRLSQTRESIDPAMRRMVDQFSARIRMDVELDRVVWPSVPTTALRVRRCLQDPSASVRDICDAISADPALATRLMRAANSASFLGAGACNDLKSAVVRLGHAVIENVALILTVARVFSVGKRAIVQSHLRKLWDHSTLVAALSEVLAERAGGVRRDVVLLAGLIHDVGKIPVIVQAQKYPTLISNPVLLEALLGALHSELGTAVLQRWNVPAELVAVAGEHEDLDADRPGPVSILDIVVVANVMGQGHDCELPDAVYSLPAFVKLEVDADATSGLVCEAASRRAALRELMR